MSRLRRTVSLCACIAVALWRPQPVLGQAEHYSTGLLPMLRRAAALPPGGAPTSVRVLLLGPWRDTLSGAVEGAPSDTINLAYSVFQIRFPRGWAVVDAAQDRALVPQSKSATFSDEVYDQIQGALQAHGRLADGVRAAAVGPGAAAGRRRRVEHGGGADTTGASGARTASPPRRSSVGCGTPRPRASRWWQRTTWRGSTPWSRGAHSCAASTSRIADRSRTRASGPDHNGIDGRCCTRRHERCCCRRGFRCCARPAALPRTRRAGEWSGRWRASWCGIAKRCSCRMCAARRAGSLASTPRLRS